MTLDIVIPTYTISNELEDLTVTCINSYKDEGTRIIVCEDGGRFSQPLFDRADVYIYNKDNVGFTKNVNRGWRYSNADFTAIVSSDTRLVNGRVKDVCVEGKVTSPVVLTQIIPYLAGCFFCVPREVRDKYGYLLEEMRTYCSDSEYDHRIREVFQQVRKVEIAHEMARTVREAKVEGGVEIIKDREAYTKLIAEGKAATE